jgi:hypothetical protein
MKATHKPPTTAATDPMRPSVLLRGAAIYLGTHGWTQHQFYELLADTADPFLPACASGAIMTAAHGCCPNLGWTSLHVEQSAEANAAILAMRVLAAYVDPEYTVDANAYCTSAIDVIGDWNDDQGRTLDEVIQTLMDAANDWETAHPNGGAR